MYSDKYYVRKQGSYTFRGTFTVSELQEQIREGHLTPDWEAIVATGQTQGQLIRATGWVTVGMLIRDGHERERPPEPESETYEQIPTASFACFQCGLYLRIRLPQNNASFRCPKCRVEFRATKAGDFPLVFVVVPDMSQFTSSAPATSARPKPETPREVLVALAAFGLGEEATFDQVRSAYHKLVQSYHPDKVAHLGVDLRRVAEAKTKELNSAYRVLETFYAA